MFEAFTWWNWEQFFLIFTGVMAEKFYQSIKRAVFFLKDERSRPYRWKCVDCIEQQDGSKFECSASEITALDNMILAHKSAAHNWNNV